MEENQPEITALTFEPHADAFLGSPFWNAILHRKTTPTGVEWRSSRIFWWIDAVFALVGLFWMRHYRKRRRRVI